MCSIVVVCSWSLDDNKSTASGRSGDRGANVHDRVAAVDKNDVASVRWHVAAAVGRVSDEWSMCKVATATPVLHRPPRCCEHRVSDESFDVDECRWLKMPMSTRRQVSAIATAVARSTTRSALFSPAVRLRAHDRRRSCGKCRSDIYRESDLCSLSLSPTLPMTSCTSKATIVMAASSR